MTARPLDQLDRQLRVAIALYGHELAQPGGPMVVGVENVRVRFLDADRMVRRHYSDRAAVAIAAADQVQP